MGLLIPADYDTRLIDNVTERRVVENLRDRLSDSWYIIPRLDIATAKRPFEVDVLIFHQDYGIAGIEVKGGRLRVDDGEWYRGSDIIEPSPPRQAQNACYELRKRLRKHHDCFQHLEIQHAIALPDCEDVGATTLGVLRDQILFRTDLENLFSRVQDLMLAKHNIGPLTAQQIEEFVAVVRPNIHFQWDPEAQARDARLSLNRIMRHQVDALSTLDANPFVFVDGSAGTGKTQLAIEWARRSASRGERVLLTCFNIPLGDYLQKTMSYAENVIADDFVQAILRIPGMPPIPTPDKMDDDWYRLAVSQHVELYSAHLEHKFDTIIVDEVQDFHPEWLEALKSLLREDGPQRLLLTGDAMQNLYGRKAIDYINSHKPSLASLSENCRNTQQIGDLLRRLGGARMATASPDGQGIFWIEANETEELISALETELEDLVGQRNIDPSHILIVSASKKDQLLIVETDPGHFECTSWEDRGEANIVCETIHRSKGLEFDVVILIAMAEEVSDSLLYVGSSRAVSLLTVISPQSVATRLGIA